MLTNLLRNIFLFALIALFIFPIFSLISVIFTEPQKLEWISALLPEYIFNTVVLMAGVGVLTFIIGVLSAWIVTYYSFPGRKIFEIALFLPLSIPGYIVAYVYVNILEFSGPVQGFIREFFGWYKGDYYFPDIKSLNGGIFIIGFSLYPYVYMLARTGFIMLSSNIAVATTLGRSPIKILTSVAIPAIRPAIVAGISLVLMEVIADFGTPQFLAIDTFTTGVYRNWFLLHDKYSASVLSCIELIFIMLLIAIEKLSRKKKVSYSIMKMNSGYHQNWHVESRLSLTFIYIICLTPILIGFIFPVIPLIYWSIERLPYVISNVKFYTSIVNSVSIASITAVISVIISIIMAYVMRKRKAISYIIRFVTMGYAMPNAVIAVSIMVFLGTVSQWVNLYAPEVMFIGTIGALLYSYLFRFLAVSLGPIESGLNKIPKEIDWSSAIMGHGEISTCVNIHIPMIKKSILTGFLLIFVDTIKELSATLIIRPFNFETMATRTYELIGDERYTDAAPSALAIVLIGLISVVILSKSLQCNCREIDQIEEQSCKIQKSNN